MTNLASISRYAFQTAVVAPLPLNPLPVSVFLDLFDANWIGGIQVQNLYLTDVVQSSADVAEERRGLTDRPSRVQALVLSGLQRGLSTRILMTLTRLADERLNFPLYSDVTRLTAAATGGAFEVFCDTSDRRFFVGARVVLVSDDFSVAEYATLSQIFSDHLVFSSSTTNDFAVGALVLPLIDVEVDLEQTFQIETDAVVQIQLTVNEVVGPSALPGLSWGLPPSYSLFNGDPVFNLEHNWRERAQIAIVRAGELYERGRGVAFFRRGERPQYEFQITLTAKTRAEYTTLGQFLDSRFGRLKPFWLINPQVLFEPTGTWATNEVEVNPIPKVQAQDLSDFLSHIAVVMKDGTIHLAELDFVSSFSDRIELHLLDFIPLISNLDDVDYVTSGHFVRLVDDVWTESWVSNRVCEVSFSAREILQEVTVEIDNLEDAPVLEGISSVDDLLFWFDASHGVLNAAGQVAIPGEEMVLWNVVPGTAINVNLFLLNRLRFDVSTPDFILDVNPDPVVNNARPSLLATTAIMDLDLVFFKFFIARDKVTTAGPDTGFTMFLCAYDMDGGAAGSNNYLFYYRGVFEWSTTEAKFFEVYDVDVAANNVAYSQINLSALQARVLVVRYNPGVASEVWDGGTLLGSAATPVSSLAINPLIIGDPDFKPRVELGDAKLNSLTHYNRSLSDAEINTVAGAIANSYNAVWIDI